MVTTVQEQVQLYFNTLHCHPEGLKGGIFQYAPQCNLKYLYQGDLNHTASDIIAKLNKYYNNSIFTTINTYKQIKKGNLRQQNNLWGIDTIMIDIDGSPKLCGLEDELVDVLKWAWNTNRLPKPNLISYTGGGGIHLYYTFERLPKTMYQSINALKWAIAELIIPYEENFPFREEATYHVDTKVFDTQRMDRVPGSINPKTGNMCICYSTKQPRYSYKELLSYVDEDKWSGKVKISQSKEYIKDIRSGSHYSQNKKVIYPKFENSKKMNPSVLAKKRIAGIMELAKNEKSFERCREMACFMLRVWCTQLQYTELKTLQTLNNFNHLLENPLSETELINNTKINKIYHFTNQYITTCLNLTSGEQKVMFKKYRPGNRKQKTVQHKVAIAKLVLEKKKIKEIAAILELSESIVKRRRAEIKKGEGFEYWANYVIPNDKTEKSDTAFPVKNIVISACNEKSSFCPYINTSQLYYKEDGDNRFYYNQAYS